MPRLQFARALGLTLFVLTVAACGSDAEADPPTSGPEPTIAAPRFDGQFLITDLSINDAERELRGEPSVSIDARYGRLEISPGCNLLLGSFTLVPDAVDDVGNPANEGPASFTVTGGTSTDCGDLGDQEQALLDAFGQVTRWEESPDGYRLSGETVALTIRGPE